jgi:hypothetical protein
VGGCPPDQFLAPGGGLSAAAGIVAAGMTTRGSGGIAPFFIDTATVRLRTRLIPVTRAKRALMLIKQREDVAGKRNVNK